MPLTAQQLADGLAKAKSDGIPVPTAADAELEEIDVAGDAGAVIGQMTPPTPAMDVATQAQILADLLTEAKANAVPEVMQLIAQIEPILAPLLTKLI